MSCHVVSCRVVSCHVMSCHVMAQASATLARSVFDGSFDGFTLNKAWRRQSPAEWAARAVTDLCDKNQVWTTGWRRLRTDSDDGSAMLWRKPRHSTLAMISSPSTSSPSPLLKTLWSGPWQRPQTTRTTRPCQTRRPNLKSSTRRWPASARPMSNLERCIALRLVYGAGPRWVLKQRYNHNHITSPLCCLTCPLSCVSCPGSQSVTKRSFFFSVMASKSVDTRWFLRSALHSVAWRLVML